MAAGFYEYCIIGLVSGILASVGAMTAASLISNRLLNIEFTFQPVWWLAATLIAAAGIGVAGLAGIRSTVTRATVATLRE